MDSSVADGKEIHVTGSTKEHEGEDGDRDAFISDFLQRRHTSTKTDIRNSDGECNAVKETAVKDVSVLHLISAFLREQIKLLIIQPGHSRR
jgi:hypothetical protein